MTVGAGKLLVKWAEKQPQWLSDGVRRLCLHGRLTDTDHAELLQMALAHYGLLDSQESAKQPLKLEANHLNSSLEESDSYLLKSLGAVRNCNRLAEDQDVTFETNGITILYGENGSGKSGYSRILKSACRARHAEEILPDIEDEAPGPQSALFTVAPVGDPQNVKPQPWSPASSLQALASLAMFDSGCARVLLNEQNEPAYSSALLDVVPEIVALIESTRTELKTRVEEAQEVPASLAPLTKSESPVGQLLRAPQLDLDRLRGLKALTAKENIAREKHQTELLSLQSLDYKIQAKTETTTADAHADRLRQLLDWHSALSEEAISRLRLAISNAIETSTVAQALIDQACGDTSPLNGVGQTPWQNLFQAAREYSTTLAYPALPYPNTDEDARCPLCMQLLDSDAKRRLHRFNEMMSGVAAKQAADANAHVSKLQTLIQELPARTVFNRWIERLETQDQQLAKDLSEWLDNAESVRKQALCAAKDRNTHLVARGTRPPAQRAAVEKIISEHRQKALDAQKLHAPEEKQRRLEELSVQIRDLADRQTLADEWSQVELRATAVKAAEKTQAAADSLKTNSATALGKKLTSAILTKPVEDGVNAELDRMGYTGLRPRVSAKGRKGAPTQGFTFTTKLKPKRISDVLSEGEQRILSLSLFLTEVNLATGKPGIILDDPVCSLDSQWAKKVATRLAQEASARQVIVFTHNISFLLELAAQCKKFSISTRTHSLHRIDGTSGHVRQDSVWDAMGLGKRITVLNKQIEVAKEEYKYSPTGKAYQKSANDIIDGLRSSWERLVEEDILNNVVERFASDVSTQRLNGVPVPDDLYEKVYWGMKECSATTKAHDHAPSGNSQFLSPDDLSALVKNLKDLRKDITTSKDKLAKKRKASVTPSI